MAGIDLKAILKAREAALALLKTNMQRQQAETPDRSFRRLGCCFLR